MDEIVTRIYEYELHWHFTHEANRRAWPSVETCATVKKYTGPKHYKPVRFSRTTYTFGTLALVG